MDYTDTSRTESRSGTALHDRPRRTLSAKTLIGDRVVNDAEEDLGKLDELMIDLPTGRIAYAVLSFGGVMGIGDKLFAVPWKALRVDQENKRIVLNVSKESLKNAPGFDQNNWPDMNETSWATEIHQYYGIRYEPYE